MEIVRALVSPVVRQPDRVVAASLAAGAAAACAVLAVVDPNQPGHYPACPTSALLGLDCPACGALRAVHALTHGDVVRALDHNVLLLAALPVALLTWWAWARVAAGRPAPAPRWPSWAGPTAIMVAAMFAVVRNLPIDALRWLDAAGS